MKRILVTTSLAFFLIIVAAAQPTRQYCLWNTTLPGPRPTYAWKLPDQTMWTPGRSIRYPLVEVIEDHRLYTPPNPDTVRPFGTYYVRTGRTVPATPVYPRVAIVTDLRTRTALATDIERWKDDVAREGWNVDEILLPPTMGPMAEVLLVKQKIYQAYLDTTRGPLTHVFLFGQVPVPYSGGFASEGAIINPDGHPEHGGAWPTDLFYADLESTPGRPSTADWTDSVVNITSEAIAQRPENRNAPFDGKFDQCQIPTDVEVAIGRVDFRRLPAFGAVSDTSSAELDLLRRYMDKDHAHRTLATRPPMRALIDDNFGPFIDSTADRVTIEAFAASGWRSFSAIVGHDNIIEGDWFAGGTRPSLDTTSVLLAYGCGGGGYEHCTGVGTTADFATSPVRAVFTELFGSYFGDFDATDNLMRAALANNGTTLTCAWSGRPHWFLHQLAHGETIGECAMTSQNNAGEYMGGMVIETATPTVATPFRLGLRGVQNDLMGDPTLRLIDMVMTPVEIVAGETGLNAVFQPVADANAYSIDVAPSRYGPYRQIVRYEPRPNENPVVAPLAMIGPSRYVRIRPLRYGIPEDPYQTYPDAVSRYNDVYGRGEIVENPASSVGQTVALSTRLRVTPTVVSTSCLVSASLEPGVQPTALVVSMLGDVVAEIPLAERDGILEGRWFPASLPPAPYLIVVGPNSQIVQVIR
jgi:hypothetical protein